MRLFIDEGAPMAELLRERRAHGAHPDYAAALLASLESDLPSDTQTAAPSSDAESRGLRLTEPLTERERDVLRLLAVGQSTPEIARALYVEVNTVRTHVKHLYDKLGVHSRDQAVWRARELSLI
jgi:LuxR family maltose regulon positive regulatory protein